MSGWIYVLLLGGLLRLTSAHVITAPPSIQTAASYPRYGRRRMGGMGMNALFGRQNGIDDCDGQNILFCAPAVGTCYTGDGGYVGCCQSSSCAARTQCIEYDPNGNDDCDSITGGCTSCGSGLPACVTLSNVAENQYALYCDATAADITTSYQNLRASGSSSSSSPSRTTSRRSSDSSSSTTSSTSSASSSSAPSSGGSSSLSTGAVAGIAVGAAVVVSIAAFLLFFFCLWPYLKRRKQEAQTSPSTLGYWSNGPSMTSQTIATSPGLGIAGMKHDAAGTPPASGYHNPSASEAELPPDSRRVSEFTASDASAHRRNQPSAGSVGPVSAAWPSPASSDVDGSQYRSSNRFSGEQQALLHPQQSQLQRRPIGPDTSPTSNYQPYRAFPGSTVSDGANTAELAAPDVTRHELADSTPEAAELGPQSPRLRVVNPSGNEETLANHTANGAGPVGFPTVESAMSGGRLFDGLPSEQGDQRRPPP